MNVIYRKTDEKRQTENRHLPLYAKSCIVVMFFRHMILKRKRSFASFLLLCSWNMSSAQLAAVKTNLLHDALGVPSAGVEVALPSRYTLNVAGTYCPVSYAGDRKWKNWSVRPEVRRWLCTPFCGAFVGVTGECGGFNIQKVPFLGLSHKRAQGTFYGGGLTLGWHEILSPHWGVEGTVGAGLFHVSYSRYEAGRCGYRDRVSSFNAVLPIGTGVSLVYMIR
jgi:hypothetical protein